MVFPKSEKNIFLNEQYHRVKKYLLYSVAVPTETKASRNIHVHSNNSRLLNPPKNSI